MGNYISKCDVALVCGLTIAGVTLEAACKIIHVSDRRIRPYLPPRWYDIRKIRRLTADDWVNVKKDYFDGVPIEKILARYDMSVSGFYKTMKREKWPTRIAGGPRSPIAIRRLPARQKSVYRKLRFVGNLSRDEALSIALQVSLT